MRAKNRLIKAVVALGFAMSVLAATLAAPASPASAEWRGFGYGAVGVDCNHYAVTVCTGQVDDWYNEWWGDEPVKLYYRQLHSSYWRLAASTYSTKSFLITMAPNFRTSTTWLYCRGNRTGNNQPNTQQPNIDCGTMYVDNR